MTSSSDPTRVRVPVGSEKLIQEGAKSYVQAIIAMNQFKEIVQGVCAELALGRREDISRVMGTDFSEDDPSHWPQKGKSLDPQHPWVCVFFYLKPAVSINIGLYWKSLDGRFQLHAITAFEFYDKTLLQKARQKVDENRDLKFQSFPYEDGCIAISEVIPDEQATLFPEKLETVLEEFLQGWEKMGGLKNLREDVAKAQ